MSGYEDVHFGFDIVPRVSAVCVVKSAVLGVTSLWQSLPKFGVNVTHKMSSVVHILFEQKEKRKYP